MLSFNDFRSLFVDEMSEYKNTLVTLQEVMAIICLAVEVRKFLLRKQRKLIFVQWQMLNKGYINIRLNNCVNTLALRIDAANWTCSVQEEQRLQENVPAA